jgi:hypothetical protein
MDSRYHSGLWARQAPFVGKPGTGRRLLGSFALLLGVAFTGWSAAELLDWLRIRSWPTVTGEIRESTVVEERVSTQVGKYRNEPIYAQRLHLRYEYQVSGRAYEGHRVDQLPVVRRNAAADAGRYPRGARVVVHFAPQSPADAVLEVTTPKAAVAGLPLGLALLACAAWLLRRGSGPRVRRKNAESAPAPVGPTKVTVPFPGEA